MSLPPFATVWSSVSSRVSTTKSSLRSDPEDATGVVRLSSSTLDRGGWPGHGSIGRRKPFGTAVDGLLR